MKKKILLIGGLGFIGTNFYKKYRNKYDIAIYDKNDYASNMKSGLWDLGPVRLYLGDISDYKMLKSVMLKENPNYVINFAAKSHVDRSINEEDTFVITNTLGVENLLKVIRDTKVRLVHFSTDEVYGDTAIDSMEEFKETDALKPSSPYSASKAAADMLVNAYNRTYGTNVVTVRPTNNYGPYQYPEKLIPFLIKRITEGKTLPIYGDGSNIREWLYVGDCCTAVELIMRQGIAGEIYNIGSGHDNRNSNVFIASQLRGTNENFEYVEDRKGHDRRYAVDSTKIKNLGWSHEVNIKEGLKKTKSWYLKRLNIIKQLKANSHIK